MAETTHGFASSILAQLKPKNCRRLKSVSSAGNISPESLGERVSENLVLTDAVGKIRFCLLYSE